MTLATLLFYLANVTLRRIGRLLTLPGGAQLCARRGA
jgi:hypothetical protein